jgi:basic amino acid/polyamine antiporter, APA family
MTPEPSKSMAATSARRLVRELGLLDATMLVAGSMIGSGIFIVSADMGRLLGSPAWLLGAWLATGLLTVMAALSYGELVALLPQAGGQYVYLREAYGPLWGFLYGWTLFLVIQTGTMAAVAVAFARFLGVLFPGLGEERAWLIPGVGWNIAPVKGVALGVLIVLTWSNSRGLSVGKRVQNVFTLAKIASLALLIAAGLAIGEGSAAWHANQKIFWSVPTGATDGLPLGGLALGLAFASAMVGSLFSSDAWNNVTFAAGEVKDPERNVPLSLALGTALVCGLYVLVNLAYLALLPLHGSAGGSTVLERGMQFAANDRVGTAAAEVMLGRAGAGVMALLILVSTFGCINGLVLAGSRVYYAMARDGLFFRNAGELNPRGVPGQALWVQCFWACLLTLSGTYSELLDYVIFAVLVFYVLTIAGVFALRMRRPEARRECRAWGYPVVPAFYMILASVIAIGLLVSEQTRSNTIPGLVLVLVGLPVYFGWRAWNRRHK